MALNLISTERSSLTHIKMLSNSQGMHHFAIAKGDVVQVHGIAPFTIHWVRRSAIACPMGRIHSWLKKTALRSRGRCHGLEDVRAEFWSARFAYSVRKNASSCSRSTGPRRKPNSCPWMAPVVAPPARNPPRM
jgi:hypothetical protein